MIEFHAGAGPDTQAIGIALEEMFLDYAIAPVRAPVPLTIVGNARLPGANNVLMALARKTNRFLPNAEAQLADREFILGAYTIADMMMYPQVAHQADALGAHPSVARWVRRMSLRPAVGRGMGAVSR